MKTRLQMRIVHGLQTPGSVCTTKGERMKRLLVVASLVAVIALAVASASLAGEVVGPPGTAGVPGSAQPDGSAPALLHSASICAANGLNDMLSTQGQTDFIVQSYGIDVSGLAPSEPADPHVYNPSSPGACNPTNQ